MTPGAAIARPRREADPLERYYTPPALAALHMDWVHAVAQVNGWSTGPCIDPCAGGGAYLETCPAAFVGTDLDPQHPDVREADFTIDWPSWGGRFVATNPPFTRAGELHSCMRLADVGGSMLLRLGALEATKDRRAMWDDPRLCAVILLGRASFRRPKHLVEQYGPLKGGAASTYAIAVWAPEIPEYPRVELILGQLTTPDQWATQALHCPGDEREFPF